MPRKITEITTTVTVILFVLPLALAQTCPNLYIEAIYPCTLSFSQDSSCSFASCLTFPPGTNSTSTAWSQCFTECCPGIPIPAAAARDSLLPCAHKFS